MVKRSLDIQQTIFARQQYLHDANKCSIFVSKYLFVCCFSSLLNFFTHVEINVKGEFTHVKGENCTDPATLGAREQWGFFQRVIRTGKRCAYLYTCMIICRRAFASGTISTCLNNLRLSRPGFEHPQNLRMQGERFNRQRHPWLVLVFLYMNLV